MVSRRARTVTLALGMLAAGFRAEAQPPLGDERAGHAVLPPFPALGAREEVSGVRLQTGDQLAVHVEVVELLVSFDEMLDPRAARDLPGEEGGAVDPAFEVLDLDRALDRLASSYPRAARVVELRYFGGLELLEIAAALEVTDRTVKRDWAFARAWLARELGGTARG